ncbi:hypothetical protein ES319_A04G046300v1 [Gossypium barbadense]|uniref:Uncharacterized protein n=1 Tax=Gossypium barbadense TaxID=3634 RepID=A0A5J5W441_GOSBA|nr:hypothetical protein ES319_A04G046300v1 [Gossypium barbadense]
MNLYNLLTPQRKKKPKHTQTNLSNKNKFIQPPQFILQNHLLNPLGRKINAKTTSHTILHSLKPALNQQSVRTRSMHIIKINPNI